MKDFLIGVSGIILQAFVGIASTMIFINVIKAKNNLISSAFNKSKGLVDKARQRAQDTNFYQRRQMATQARKQERQRAHVENYADTISGTGWRSRMLRRRAAGGMVGQVFNTNQAGQERILQNAEDQLRKQRHEESERAGKRMTQIGIEGDDDLFAIASGKGVADGVYKQTRKDASGVAKETGVVIKVGHAEQQAAIDALVAQGRVSRLRALEDIGVKEGKGRGPGGTPQTELHRMLDEAYTTVSNKLGDKAPDLVPNRRASQGMAAFTDLQPEDVSAWHHSTVTQAEKYYTDAAITDPTERAFRDKAQDQALRAFGEAAKTPATLAKLSPEQVANFRNMMKRRQLAGGAVDLDTVKAVNEAYIRKGGNLADPVPPLK